MQKWDVRVSDALRLLMIERNILEEDVVKQTGLDVLVVRCVINSTYAEEVLLRQREQDPIQEMGISVIVDRICEAIGVSYDEVVTKVDTEFGQHKSIDLENLEESFPNEQE